MSFHEMHDLAAVAAQADFCVLLQGVEAGLVGLLLGLLALLRA